MDCNFMIAIFGTIKSLSSHKNLVSTHESYEKVDNGVSLSQLD